MTLTVEQQKEAEAEYIRKRLDEHSLSIIAGIQECDEQESVIAHRRAQLREDCTHPLIAREAENGGYSGHFNSDEGYYWTDHKCGVCGLRWKTNQRWRLVGGKEGQPDDEAATRNPD